MTIIEQIAEKLSAHPRAKFEVGAHDLCVYAADDQGFDVSIAQSRDCYVVYYAGWHAHFADEAEARDCFSFGLLGACRLVITTRGKSEVAWELQVQQGGTWVTESKVELLIIPFWRPKQTLIRSNQNRTDIVPLA